MSRKYVILDCDGSPDDAWGLALLLKADEMQKTKLLAVICGHGIAKSQIGQAAVNVYRILRAAGRLDIPIYWGAEAPLIQPTTLDGVDFFHGNDGFGDVFPNDVNFRDVIQSQQAVEAIYDLINRYPKEITYIVSGPLTNLALAMTMYGEQWYRKIKKVYIKAGNYKAVGNATSATEFNFYMDPEAAHIVLKKVKCPVTILPWESNLAPYFDISVDWRFSVLGAVNNPIVDILDTVETAVLIPKGYTDWQSCTAVLIAIFFFGDQLIINDKDWNGVVDVNGCLTRGQMLIDHLRDHRDNIRLVEKVNSDVFKTIILWAVGSPTPRSAFLQNPKCE